MVSARRIYLRAKLIALMKNKIVVALVVILIAAVSYLAVQNIKLNKKVEEIAAVKEDAKTAPATTPAKPINPAEVSPFDKPNTDPLANQFPVKEPGPQKITSIKFDRMVHDFGRINEGQIVHTSFKFTNSGKLPLLIAKAEGSCGCTVPRWPQQPIQPGESAEISVQFDSHDKMGEVEKTVKVTANTLPATVVLTIKSTVIPKDK